MAVRGGWRPLSGIICEIVNLVGQGNFTFVREKSGKSQGISNTYGCGNHVFSDKRCHYLIGSGRLSSLPRKLREGRTSLLCLFVVSSRHTSLPYLKESPLPGIFMDKRQRLAIVTLCVPTEVYGLFFPIVISIVNYISFCWVSSSSGPSCRRGLTKLSPSFEDVQAVGFDVTFLD